MDLGCYGKPLIRKQNWIDRRTDCMMRRKQDSLLPRDRPMEMKCPYPERKKCGWDCWFFEGICTLPPERVKQSLTKKVKK